MKNSIIFLLVFITSGCILTPENKKSPEVHITNPAFEKIIGDYAGNIKFKKNKNITVLVEKAEDTTFVSLINSLPDTAEANLNGVIVFDRCSLYFVGAYPAANIYKIGKKTSPVIIESKVDKDISKIKHTEPLFWKLFFVGDTLVKRYPTNADSIR